MESQYNVKMCIVHNNNTGVVFHLNIIAINSVIARATDPQGGA